MRRGVEPEGRHGVSGSTMDVCYFVFRRSRLRRCFAVRLRFAPLRMTRGGDVLQYYSVSPISVTQTKQRRLAFARRLWVLFKLFDYLLAVECGADNCGKLRIIGDDEIYVELI